MKCTSTYLLELIFDRIFMRVGCHESLVALAVFVSVFSSQKISEFGTAMCHALNNISPYSTAGLDNFVTNLFGPKDDQDSYREWNQRANISK